MPSSDRRLRGFLKVDELHGGRRGEIIKSFYHTHLCVHAGLRSYGLADGSEGARKREGRRPARIDLELFSSGFGSHLAKPFYSAASSALYA